MRNVAFWTPSKYVMRRGRLVGSRNTDELSVSSRLSADLTASFYERHLPKYARGRLLDLGCGKVPLYFVYSRLVSESVCVDWAMSVHESQHLDYECDLSQELPFVDDHFDTVILSDVLEHIPTPEALCSEVARVLVPGGCLIMNVPFFYWLHEEPHDYYRYTQHALRRFVELSGLQVVTLEATGGSPELSADLLAKHLVRLPMIGSPLASLVQWLMLRFVGTTIGLRLSCATRNVFPFGYFLVATKA